MAKLKNMVVLALLPVMVLAGCGGGGESATSQPPQPQTTPSAAALNPGAPAATGDAATDGFNWFNYRRQQLGVRTLARNGIVDRAAAGHSNYQMLNDVITHEQQPGRPGFTGITVDRRLSEAGYRFTQNGLAYGEVISATSDPSGFNAAEDLIAAIYHRFVIFEPIFKETGTGASRGSAETTYFTAKFTANGLDSGLGSGGFVVYPFANQQAVPTNFFSDNEVPDPVPQLNEVGYPVSVHADITATVSVGRFSIRPRGGAELQTQLLTRSRDPLTPASAAAIIPVNPLRPGQTYDVHFSGVVDNVPVSRDWSFTTQ